MFSNVTNYVKEQLENTDINKKPYPHIIVENVFPQEFYDSLLSNRIDDDCLSTLSELKRVDKWYPQSRKILELSYNLPILSDTIREFWEETYYWFNSFFGKLIIKKFEPYILNRFGKIPRLSVEVLYTRDRATYKLGPHTDSTKKVLTLLFYLPKNKSNSKLGTSMYVPLDKKFTCPGGPRYDFDKFKKIYTAPYIPNTMFGFLKTDNSFHGVESIDVEIERDLLIYDIQVV